MPLDPRPAELATARAAKRTMESAMTEAATRFERDTGFAIDHFSIQRVSVMSDERPVQVLVTADVRREIVL